MTYGQSQDVATRGHPTFPGVDKKKPDAHRCLPPEIIHPIEGKSILGELDPDNILEVKDSKWR